MRRRSSINIDRLLTWLRHHYMILVVIVFLLIGIYATLSILENDSRETGEKKDKLILLVDAGGSRLAMYEPRSFNALSSMDEDMVYLNQLVYSSLFKLDDGLNIEPDLVNIYEVEPDTGGVYIELRKDALYPDGTLCTAADVQRTITRIKELGVQSPYYRYAAKVANVITYDESTLFIQFNSPEDAALDNLVFPIVSVADYSLTKGFTKGSGPFSFADYVEGKSLKLVPNPNYYGGAPLYTVEITLVKDKEKVPGLMTMDAVTAFLNKNPGADVVAEDKSLKYDLIPSGELEYIGFNMNREYTARQEVREAIARAIDREKIVNEDYGTMGMVSDSLYYPGFLGADKNKGIEKDTMKTIESLTAIGLSDIDEDGIIEEENGEDWSLTLIVSGDNINRSDAANNIALQLSSIGVIINVESLPENEYKERLESGDWDIYFGGIKMDKQFKMTELFGSGNDISYSNDEVLDQVKELEKAHRTEELTEIFASLKSSLNKDLPYFGICYRTYCFTTVDTFSSSISAQYFNPYRGIETWRWQKRVTVDNESEMTEEEEKEA